jgi:hypothetical protein
MLQPAFFFDCGSAIGYWLNSDLCENDPATGLQSVQAARDPVGKVS